MYDLPIATSSSPPPSPHKHYHHHHHHHRRSHSPIPHIATLLPHHHCAAHSQYSPATRAADISRLLDPAYASSSSSGSSASASPTHASHAQPRAYVDHHGDLHDPDYRDFPVLRPTARARHTNRGRRASTGTAAARSTSRGPERYAGYGTAPRPEWERDWSAELEDEEDEDVDDDAESQSHYSPFASRLAATPPRRSVTIPSAYRYKAYAQYLGEPVHMSASPAGSYEEEHSNALQLHESPFLEDEEDDVLEEQRSKERRASFTLGRRRTKKSDASATVALTDEQSEKADAEYPPHSQSPNDDDDSDVPSCTYALRQQWAATVLRIRFGVFHAKRRFSGRRRSAST
ncbi:hypothetical protein AcV7_008754 [Taiwanofungus camphoratus]|nr:hypothetical protein AcV7_008754 [Antrodia cinnamomea]